MDLNFFKKTRILDGGVGQELLARGMEANGTLWSANALLNKKYHKLLLDTHIDFIKSIFSSLFACGILIDKTRLLKGSITFSNLPFILK